MQNTNCIVVLGPTASGKTRLACDIAFHLNAEIISLDSRQVYKGLDIGTGKDFREYFVQGKQIPYHLIDVCEPTQQFYLHDFIRELRISFENIVQNEKIPILCGGTGLYLDALRKDFSFTQIPEDHNFRERSEEFSKEELLKQLEELPEVFRAHVDTTSRKRLVRGIEVGRYLSKNKLTPSSPTEIYKPIYLGIKTDTDTIRKKIRGRLLLRMENGLIEEAESLLQKGLSHHRMQELGLEYKYLSFYLQNKITMTELTEQLYTAICHYAKRQMTWFRKMEREGVYIHWVDAAAKAEDLISKFELKP